MSDLTPKPDARAEKGSGEVAPTAVASTPGDKATLAVTGEVTTPLDLDLVQERLDLKSGLLVEEVQKHVLAQFQAEEDRNKTLDTKATALLTVTGLSFTVAFSFGASVLIRDADNLRPLGPIGFYLMIGAFVLAMVLGIAAGVLAVVALRIQEFKGIDPNDVFRKQVLEQADTPNAEGSGLAIYRQYMTAHIWAVTQENAATAGPKATKILLGQALFAGFLLCVLAVALGVAVAACRGGLPPAKDDGKTGPAGSATTSARDGAAASSSPPETSVMAPPSRPQADAGTEAVEAGRINPNAKRQGARSADADMNESR
jgi:hypothetical protein